MLSTLFLDCEKLLLPNVTLHIRLYRSPNNTIIHLKGTDDEGKAHDGKLLAIVEKASLFLRKVVVTDSVKLSIERALVKSDAMYPYIESLNKSFIIQAGQNCFIKENIFGTRPIRRLTMCMVKNSLFRSTPLNESPFSYQKFNLQRVEKNPKGQWCAFSWDTIGYYKQCEIVLQYDYCSWIHPKE